MKERIIKKFNKSTYTEYAEIDDYIVDIMKEINSYSNIMTVDSCEGHYMGSHHSIPYFTFLVDEKGWDIFWNKCAPELCTGITENNTIFYSKIQINTYIDENGIDYCYINIYGSDDEKYKELFWNNIKKVFKYFF